MQSDRIQCTTDTDCELRGDAFLGSRCIENLCQSSRSASVGPWGCLGYITPTAPSTGTHNVSLFVADIISNKPVAGLAVRVCYKLDSTCISPLIPSLVSDASGQINFTVPAGFDGYMESTGPEAFPFSYFFFPPVTADRVVPNVPVLPPGALSTFSALVGVQLSPERGHVMARTYNCQGKTAEGVRYSASTGDSSTIPFYMIAGIPSTREAATDTAGNGGLLNVPAGAATLTGTVVGTGQTLGKPQSLVILPGRITFTAMVPTP